MARRNSVILMSSSFPEVPGEIDRACLIGEESMAQHKTGSNRGMG